jgi:hypothetical protein
LTLADNISLNLGANQSVGAVSFGNATISGSGTLTGSSYTATNLGAATKVVTVSSNGLLTAGVEGWSVVEVSFPFASNQVGTTGAASGNPMHGLPSNKIYTEVNVLVTS